MATEIKKPPTGGVSQLHLKRGSYRIMQAGWKVPDSLTASNSDKRANKLMVAWYLGIAGTKPKRTVITNDMGTTSHSVNLNEFEAGRKTYTRSDFYPLAKRRLAYVTCKVRAGNGKGWSSAIVSETYKFEAPRAPKIGSYSVNNNGTISVTVTTPADSGKYERYDTEYYFSAKNSTTGEKLTNRHSSSTSTEFTLSVDASSYQSLGTGYIECKCRVRSRGYGGASDWVEKGFCLAYPNAPVFDKDAKGSNSGIFTPTSITGTVIAYIKTNSTYWHPTTKVQLQALVNVEYATVAEASAAAGEWEDVGGPDNGDCTALAVPVSEVKPTTAGYHSWLRIKSNGPIEGVLVRYSQPVELKELYRPPYTATGDIVKILDAHAGEDGKSAVVLLGWAPAGSTDNSTGTELSWASELDTWRSTEEPDIFNVLYDDGSVTFDNVTYQHSATITIKGLADGQTTYIKARRYHESDSGTTYGNYSDVYMITPAVIPASVVLEVDGYVAEGEGLTVTWTYDGGATQDAWCIYNGSGAVVAEGVNALGSTTIDAERLAALATNGVIELRVAVSMGGAWVTSTAKRVTIVARPTLTASTAATLTAQPMAISVGCDAADASLVVVVTSDGTSGMGPAGMETQAAGDVVWSDVVNPEWSSGAAAVTLPDGRAFVDGCGYTATITATDPSTGLSSEPVTVATTVAWSHQAPDPEGCATLTTIDTVDADGIATKSVQLALTPPTGSVSTDCYDIYRLTGDGAQLIGEGYPLTVTTTDAYAPYGEGMELAYRIACRTSDGDVEWADVPYTLGGKALRIDWDGRYVELPYDIAIDDSYSKDVDVHEYLDGSTDAFFNQGIRRSAKLATNVMRLVDADTIAGVLALAHHIGPAFVRTPTGAAYEAAVNVDSVTPTRELAAVSITATEVHLTAAYQLPEYNVVTEDDDA